MPLTLTSPAFEQGDPIPTVYTCDGDNRSPALEWSRAPEQARSLVLIMDDPDAPSGDFVHWVVYNLPPDLASLKEDTSAGDIQGLGAENGSNGRGQEGYTGPCPPSGEHRYFFKLYALDATLDLGPGVNKAQVEAAISGHVLDQTVLMGVYAR